MMGQLDLSTYLRLGEIMNPKDHFSWKSTNGYQNMMLWNVNLRSNIAISGTLPETNAIPKEKKQLL